jgi:2',3'-cyclic-nucleotide 2'-phosphodiesterase (5'-nucleotidase family)
VDAGNAFFGAESIESRGEVMVCAYDKLGYDAVNLSYRDFRFGKETTLNLLRQAHFAAVSANLLDDQTGSLLAKPYVIKNVGGPRVSLIGVTQSPAGLDYLAHLKEQLAGIRIQPPLEALRQWLPIAKAHSDIIILLFYGSEVGLQPIRDEFAKDVTIILVGGTLPEYLPYQSIPPMIGTYPRGRDVAYAKFELKTREIDVTQLAIEPTIEPDPEMKRLLANYLNPITRSPSRPILQSRRR